MNETLAPFLARLTAPQEGQPAQDDRLGWGEKIPLTLALIAQSYVIFNWYLNSVHGVHNVVDFLVAIAAGIALDLMVVTTTMGRREGRESKWSHATALGAFLCSAAIALNVYSEKPLLPEGWLHVAFPLEVWLYSQHLATRKRIVAPAVAEVVQEAPEKAQSLATDPIVQIQPAKVAKGPVLLPSLIAELQPMEAEGLQEEGDLQPEEAPVQKPDGISEGAWRAWWLVKREGKSQGEAAAILGKSVSTVSRCCAKVEEVLAA